jgi:hypothetical protein
MDLVLISLLDGCLKMEVVLLDAWLTIGMNFKGLNIERMKELNSLLKLSSLQEILKNRL